KEAATQLTLRLADVPLEAAVCVLAASAGLGCVRLDRVLFVTTPARAKDLQASAQELQRPLPPASNPFGVMPQVGLLGALGAVGVGGGGLQLGVGGALGIGGGALGLRGGALGIGGGVAGVAGGAGIMGVPPQQEKPKEKPQKPPTDPTRKVAEKESPVVLVASGEELPAQALGAGAQFPLHLSPRQQERRVQALPVVRKDNVLC